MTTLMPRDGCRYLKPEEVFARMQATFKYVEITEEGARDHVAAWMQQLAFVTEGGRCADAHQLIDQLEQSQDAACFVHFGNDLGADGMCLSMLMIPHQPLTIDGHGTDHQTLALIDRCAAALEYEVFAPHSEKREANWNSEEFRDYAATA